MADKMAAEEKTSKLYKGPVGQDLLVGLEFYKVLKAKGESQSHTYRTHLNDSHERDKILGDLVGEAVRQAHENLESLAEADDRIALVASLRTSDCDTWAVNTAHYSDLFAVFAEVTVESIAYKRKQEQGAQ